MHKLLVVEDDEVQRTALKIGICEEYPNWIVLTASDYDTAVNLITESVEQKELFSMFLLDIQLKQEKGDMSGFAVAEFTRSYEKYYKTPILFLTAISEKTQFALATYHCYNYITKPYRIQDIIYQIQQMQLTGYLNENTITITDTMRLNHRILRKEILYFEFKSHQTVIYTTTGTIVSRKVTQADLAQQLTDNFIQCHKKYLINLDYVKSYARSNGYLNISDSIIPVSRTFKTSVENALKDIL